MMMSMVMMMMMVVMMMIYDIIYMIYDVWYMIYDIIYMIHDLWWWSWWWWMMMMDDDCDGDDDDDVNGDVNDDSNDDDDVVDIWNGALATVSCTFCRPHLPKVLLAWWFFTIFMWNQALATVFCRPHPTVFYDFYVKSSSRCSVVHLLPTSPSKSAPRPQVFYDFYVKASYRYSPAALFVNNFPRSSRAPRKQRPSLGDQGRHFTRKNTEFRARECFQAWIHAFPISYYTWWWCGCHDDVVDRMIDIYILYILTWWCGCHAGEKAGHDNRP